MSISKGVKTNIVLILMVAGFVLAVPIGWWVWQKAGSTEESSAPDYSENGAVEEINLSNLPKFVTHNVVELDKISRISKFRGGYGHDYSYGDEFCRSMKHYFWAKSWDDGSNTSTDIRYFTPAAGTIVELEYKEELPGITEAYFRIKSEEYPQVYFAFFHMTLREGLKEGNQVEAGEWIGNVAYEDVHAEIAVEVQNGSGDKKLVSFFELIDDSVFEEYQERGVGSIDELIILKEERDANPLDCEDDSHWSDFVGKGTATYDDWAVGEDNWVFLD